MAMRIGIILIVIAFAIIAVVAGMDLLRWKDIAAELPLRMVSIMIGAVAVVSFTIGFIIVAKKLIIG